MIAAAAELFAGRAYDGLSVDDLVGHLGVHRNSLYKTFGSKRGLYLSALRWYVEHQLAADRLDLLLMAAVEQAPVDPEVAAIVTAALAKLDGDAARLLGARLLARINP